MHIKRKGYAHFIRKPSNILELIDVQNTFYKNKYPEQKYEIIDIVKVDINEYQDFCESIIGKDYNFLKPYTRSLYSTENLVKCILLTIIDNETKGILINSEGSLYGRYCAIWK